MVPHEKPRLEDIHFITDLEQARRCDNIILVYCVIARYVNNEARIAHSGGVFGMIFTSADRQVAYGLSVARKKDFLSSDFASALAESK